MSPSHTTPAQVSTVMKQIITLLDSVDNKILLAYYDLLAAKVRDHSYSGAHDVEYQMLTHMFVLKVILQNERRKNTLVNA